MEQESTVRRRLVMRESRWSISWKWYDLWVGAFYDEESRVWYFCPFPTIVIAYDRKVL